MFGLLLLVIGCYLLAALTVHLVYRIQQGRLESSKHYVWIADSRQKNMEWYMRSLFSFSRRMGKDVRLTIVDSGVSEETLAIVERLAKENNKVRIYPRLVEPLAQKEDGKRSHLTQTDATQLLWLLQAEGIVSNADHAVLVDLHNPADLSKMPF